MDNNNNNENNARPLQRRRAPNGSYIEVSSSHVTESNRLRDIERNRERSEALSRLFATRLAIDETYATAPNNQGGGRHRRKTYRRKRASRRKSYHKRKTHRKRK